MFYRFGKSIAMDARPLIELKEYRERHGLTLEEAALALGVKPPTVSRWERGKRAPDRESVRKIACLTGVPEAQLAGYD